MTLEQQEQMFELELNEKQDIVCEHFKQRLSENGRIVVSKKAWIARALMLSVMIGFMIYNINIALTIGDPLIVYSTIMPFHAVAVFAISWLFFKSKTNIKTPDDLVSIIIPVYNQEKLIKKVINAVFCSTYDNIEVIAVNDGSKDKTGIILDFLANQNPKLKVIHKPNGGKRTAVATGFYAAQGDYVVLLDSDSILDEYAIEELMKTLASSPDIGGVVGNGRVLNADKNILTRCQDAWYDYAFNIHKTVESTFGTVLCLSGCLAAYRRKAISRFIPLWAEDKAQYGDDRHLSTYVIATPWVKGQLSQYLMKSMARYDDSEDRGLTAQTLMNWKTIYVPTAVVHTEVPEDMRKYLRQQIRWKKGFLRSTFFVSAFFWRKNPVIATLFYIEFMSMFISPAVLFSIYFYGPLILSQYSFPIIYLLGQMLIGFIAGLDYKFRNPTTKKWIYKPLMNIFSAVVLPWVLVPALLGLKKNGWLTR